LKRLGHLRYGSRGCFIRQHSTDTNELCACRDCVTYNRDLPAFRFRRQPWSYKCAYREIAASIQLTSDLVYTRRFLAFSSSKPQFLEDLSGKDDVLFASRRPQLACGLDLSCNLRAASRRFAALEMHICRCARSRAGFPANSLRWPRHFWRVAGATAGQPRTQVGLNRHYLPEMVKHMEDTAPKGADLTSWKY
jgi:hypothetical protein